MPSCRDSTPPREPRPAVAGRPRRSAPRARMNDTGGRASVQDAQFGGRRPTSHERMSGLPWDASYHDGPAPWEIGGPQPLVMRLASEGRFAGTVLDAGCGSGENALHIASLGLPVV